jgi:farnesyl diphosphate synthase/geranylgeranyl diphosphate synthase type II
VTPDPAADLLAEARGRTDALLARWAARLREEIGGRHGEALAYALQTPGKRVRAALVFAAFRSVGGTSPGIAGVAAAVETVHAYSLVHDDLPCMDDDDMRRGRPTVHRVFGVAAATAAGLAMVPLAVLSAANAARALALDDWATGSIVAELMRASGAGGMIGGQLLDLDGEGRPLELADLEQIHRAKTGALIMASATLGGRAASAPEARLQALSRYGAAVGLAFQIADDVLDVTATTDQLGKTAGRDLALKKSTYPALLGVAGAKARAAALIDDGCRALDEVGLLTPTLERIARFSVERTS